MQAWCQISTSTVETLNPPVPPSSCFRGPALRFPADSKILSCLLTPSVQPQHPVFRAFGLERAFSEVPAKLKVFHPEAARRDL
jgi:hypothetical protein